MLLNTNKGDYGNVKKSTIEFIISSLVSYDLLEFFYKYIKL